MQRLVNMSEKRISLGINVSILVILIIFGVLLSLPLRLMMNTNYYTQNQTGENENLAMEAMGNAMSKETTLIPLDHRKLKRCPRLQYQDRLKSVFRSDYDGNCTYRGVYASDNIEDDDEEVRIEMGSEDAEDRSKTTKETVGDNLTESTEESGKDRRMKSVPVAGHILVTMLLISAIAALVEVLRIRFARDKDSSKAGRASSRKASTVELPVQRRFVPRQPMLSHRSFEMQGMHRSALRLLGAKPPPLIRRSSFPTQPCKQTVFSLTGTPNNWMSRRQSAESDEDSRALISTLHHRTRLIRRH